MPALPSQDWIKDTLHTAYDAMHMGPVEVSVMYSDLDAVAQVRLLAVKNREGACAVSAFRFKAGNGDIRRNIQREVSKAVKTLERAIYAEKSRKLDG